MMFYLYLMPNQARTNAPPLRSADCCLIKQSTLAHTKTGHEIKMIPFFHQNKLCYTLLSLWPDITEAPKLKNSTRRDPQVVQYPG